MIQWDRLKEIIQLEGLISTNKDDYNIWDILEASLVYLYDL